MQEIILKAQLERLDLAEAIALIVAVDCQYLVSI